MNLGLVRNKQKQVYITSAGNVSSVSHFVRINPMDRIQKMTPHRLLAIVFEFIYRYTTTVKTVCS